MLATTKRKGIFDVVLEDEETKERKNSSEKKHGALG